MSRGNPKRLTTFRLDPALLAAARATGVPLTQVVEQGISLWLVRLARREQQHARRQAARKQREAA